MELSRVSMPTQTFLGVVNPEDLFEKHSIAEIKILHDGIRNEIEKKREELRTMVGEKCRDLLKAADTITEMKDTARTVILGIGQMKMLCQNFQEKRFCGSRQESKGSGKKFFNNAEEISRIIEIKILLSIPEQIWTAIDQKDYLLGAQLFLFATHLQLGLEVSPSARKIFNKYSVVSKQWEMIRSCKKVIIEGSLAELKVINLSHQKAAECLCNLILLEAIPYEKLMAQFLDVRLSALETVFKSEELSRKKLGLIIVLLQHTLVILYNCFLEKSEKQCAIQTRLNLITGEESKPTLTKIMQVSSLPEHSLSPLIINYRPKTPRTVTPPSREFIATTLTKWLANFERILRAEVTKLLLLIDDIKLLHKILKEEIYNLEYPRNWNEIVSSLLGEDELDIYEKFVKSYVTERIRSLIKITWENNVDKVLVRLMEMDEDASKTRKKQPESDIRWFVWKESMVDAEEGLKLRTKGYTSSVMELCDLMNLFLSRLEEDVKLYVAEESASKSEARDSDACSIFQFLNSCSLEMLKKFARKVKESFKERKDADNESNVILRARFLSSLIVLCPGLEKCLKQIRNFQEDLKQNTSENMWQEAVGYLNEESIQLWGTWRTLTSNKLRHLIKNNSDSKTTLRNLLKSKPLSEVITIEEQAEDGTLVKSDLRVPSQPSLPLQDLLFRTCQHLNAIAPHTLPKQIHDALVEDLVKDILVHYEELSRSEVIFQSQAWQMLLDIKFLTLLVVTKENNKDLSQNVCEALEKKIDPFDLDVYFPHLQNSVKKSAQKLQGTFGTLINFAEKLPVLNGLKLSQTGPKIEEPNLLAVPSNVPWFPLLPTTTFGSRRSESTRYDSRDSPSYREPFAGKTNVRGKEKENKKESVTSDFFKSAGAFFDAVTGGWS